MTAPARGARRSRSRRHPAARARRGAAVASVTAAVLLVGWLRVAAPSASADADGTSTGVTPGPVPTTTVDNGWSDGSSWSADDGWGARPATPAPTPDTTTSGS